MNHQWQRLYQPPASPLARFGLAALGLAVLVVSFFLGLLLLAIVAGMAVLGAAALAVRRAWLRWKSGERKATGRNEDTLEVEYTVVERRKDTRPRDR